MSSWTMMMQRMKKHLLSPCLPGSLLGSPGSPSHRLTPSHLALHRRLVPPQPPQPAFAARSRHTSPQAPAPPFGSKASTSASPGALRGAAAAAHAARQWTGWTHPWCLLVWRPLNALLAAKHLPAQAPRALLLPQGLPGQQSLTGSTQGRQLPSPSAARHLPVLRWVLGVALCSGLSCRCAW